MSRPVVTIIGLGVVGGSYAGALTEAGYKVFGVARSDETIAKAKQRGMIADGGTDAARFVSNSDVVVIALYPGQIAPYLRTLAPYLRPGTVVSDVAGIKSTIQKEVEEALPDGVEFVFAHPMAGREKRGIDYADPAVLKSANFILVPGAKASQSALDTMRKLAEDMGFGRVAEVSAKRHDEIIAFVSQLPHAIAVALVNSDEESAETEKFIGDSFRDLTRIASINEKLWSELFLCNRDNLIRSIDDFERQLGAIKTALQQDDKDALEALFRSSSERRSRYVKK